MPVYEYHCASCGSFTRFRPVDKRNRATACPDCHDSATRVLAVPNLALMSASIREALVRNEKSCHEPSVHHRRQCLDHSGSKKVNTQPKGNSRTLRLGDLGVVEVGRRGKRPWMLGH